MTTPTTPSLGAEALVPSGINFVLLPVPSTASRPDHPTCSIAAHPPGRTPPPLPSLFPQNQGSSPPTRQHSKASSRRRVSSRFLLSAGRSHGSLGSRLLLCRIKELPERQGPPLFLDSWGACLCSRSPCLGAPSQLVLGLPHPHPGRPAPPRLLWLPPLRPSPSLLRTPYLRGRATFLMLLSSLRAASLAPQGLARVIYSPSSLYLAPIPHSNQCNVI